jgi:uncharacterized protein (DUF4415 family)
MNENPTSPAAGDLDEAPVWSAADFDAASRRHALQPVARKVKISIALDADVLAWYKAKAGGRGYQTLINATLREARKDKRLTDDLRRILREELHRV